MKDSEEYPVSAASEDLTLHSKRKSKPSATSKKNPIAKKSSKRGCKMYGSTKHPSGLIYLPSTANRGLDGWISSLEDSHAKTSVIMDLVKALKSEIEVGYGSRCLESLMRFDPVSSSWKTCQTSLLKDFQQSWKGYIRGGIMLNGRLYRHHPSERLTKGIDGSVWLATPVAQMRPRSKNFRYGGGYQRLPTPIEWVEENFGISIPPIFLEWVMGFPKGWTDLNASVMQWFPPKDNEHGEF